MNGKSAAPDLLLFHGTPDPFPATLNTQLHTSTATQVRRLKTVQNAARGASGQQPSTGRPLHYLPLRRGSHGPSWQTCHIANAQKDALQQAEKELLHQQGVNKLATYSLEDTQTAMFAAVGGLAYTIAEVLKLQGYMGYLLPMPIVLSAMHSGANVARKTLVATCLLLLVLLGPLQATGYFLQHGCAAWALGALWAAGVPWLPSILISGVARMAGIVSFLAFTSWTLNENVYRLLVTKIASLLDQMGAVMGISGTPSILVIQGVMFSFLLVNCLMYIGLLHVLYAILLRSMGYKSVRMPRFLESRLLPAQFHAR